CIHTLYVSFFFCTAPAPTQIYTLSLHDALPISSPLCGSPRRRRRYSVGVNPTCALKARLNGPIDPNPVSRAMVRIGTSDWPGSRSEEHTSELQSRGHLVCRLLLEKKKKKQE